MGKEDERLMHPKQAELEDTMSQMCRQLDDYLEDKYGNLYRIHPNRPVRGRTANPNNDGLFSTGTMFTLGYGSDFGRGYIIDIEIRSLEKIPSEERQKIEKDGIAFITKRLGSFFPDRKLEIVRDKTVWKLIGDFSLGTV
ncbi:MAG: hypothetical protein SO135_08000 [Sphaerochaetaceae bacterium]|jgi:hypothetical protein|nr:hypothetical protein [Sphaerochaetaceae bacterium]